MVVNVITIIILCAYIVTMRLKSLSKNSRVVRVKEPRGSESDLVLHGLERNLTILIVEVAIIDVEDLQVCM